MRNAIAVGSLAVLLLAGCSTAESGQPAPSPTTTTTTPPPTTTTSAGLTAANGTDVNACVNANCQILVTGAVLRFEPKTDDPNNNKASGSEGVATS